MDIASSFFGRRLKICWHVQTTREEEGDASSVFFFKLEEMTLFFGKSPDYGYLWVNFSFKIKF